MRTRYEAYSQPFFAAYLAPNQVHSISYHLSLFAEQPRKVNCIGSATFVAWQVDNSQPASVKSGLKGAALKFPSRSWLP
jgi:hypothetical protein